jgi:hypothetical protein
MAATATQQVLNDGHRNLILQYTIGGTTGDLAASVLVDASAFNDRDGVALGANSLTLVKVQSSLTGFSAKLLWDATTDVDLVELPSGENLIQDMTEFGGIKNNSGAASTGDVLLTTTGYTAGGDGGSFVLYFRKT